MMSYKYGTKLIKKVENRRKRWKREGIEWASAIKVWQVAGIYYTQEFNGGDNVIVEEQTGEHLSSESNVLRCSSSFIFSVFFFPL